MNNESPVDCRLVEMAWQLDRLRWVPREVLGEIVVAAGACIRAYADDEPPRLTGIDTADREMAARLCAGCPVQDECLELELRMAGPDTTGVWGALPEVHRRALYPHWRQRGERAEPFEFDDTAFTEARTHVHEPSERSPRTTRRRSFDEYLSDAREAWSPGVVVTPAWVRQVTDCSRGLSSRLAIALAAELDEPGGGAR